MNQTQLLRFRVQPEFQGQSLGFADAVRWGAHAVQRGERLEARVRYVYGWRPLTETEAREFCDAVARELSDES